MSEKRRSIAADYAVYLIVRLLVCVLQALSLAAARKLAAALAWLAYRIDRRHRAVALDNLRHAFPGRFSEIGHDQAMMIGARRFNGHPA